MSDRGLIDLRVLRFGAGAVLASALVVPLTGCVSSTIEQVAEPKAMRLGAGEAVVVIPRADGAAYATDAEFADCVAEQLADAGIETLPAGRFADRLFPCFEPLLAPREPEAVPKLLEDPHIRARLRETGVRYVVWLDGVTRDGDDGGTMSCAVGPGGGGCLGFMWWEKEAAYEAEIWDLQRARRLAKVGIDATGRSFMPAVIVPVPLIARTDSAVCGGLAGQLTEVMNGTGS